MDLVCDTEEEVREKVVLLIEWLLGAYVGWWFTVHRSIFCTVFWRRIYLTQ